MRNHSNENKFDLHENGCAGETHFHIEWFRMKTRFDPEEKGNSELEIISMCMLWFNFILGSNYILLSCR